MVAQNLSFNILTFNWPKEKATFYFSLTEAGHCQRIHKSIFPNTVESIFPGINNNGTEFIYTTFSREREDFLPMEIDFQKENPDFIKRYFDRQANYYFSAIKKQIVKVGFVKENQVWLPAETPAVALKENHFDYYEKYSLKVQICSVSKFPEIQLSYDGRSKVLKKSLAEIIHEVSPINFKWVLHNGQLYKFDTLSENGLSDYENVYPVVGFNLFRALGFEFPGPKPVIRSKSYK
jgi:hypothetical protein